MKEIELFYDLDDSKLEQVISLVDEPAIDENFLFFSSNFKFSTLDTDKRIVTGPAMIPDLRIPRKFNDEIVLVYFSKETIQDYVFNFFKNNRHNITNTNHNNDNKNDVLNLLESWFIKEEGKYPIGTWMVTYKVLDDNIWNDYIKTGLLRGFSVEGSFEYLQESEEDKLMRALETCIKNGVTNESEIFDILKNIKY
jgi:hypothetical protein